MAARKHHHQLHRWVIVNGARHHVSDFADLPPGKRPEATCPACHQPVDLRLGQQRLHYYAHKHEHTCPMQSYETALHWATKMHIAGQLEKGRRLLIEDRCSYQMGHLSHHEAVVDDLPGCLSLAINCGYIQNHVWQENWDEIRVEEQIDSRRPDIVLLRNSVPIAAIEVHVTHAVDEDKAADLKASGIPWIEVHVDKSFLDGDSRWTIDQPLRFKIYTLSEKLERWFCDECRNRIQTARFYLDNHHLFHAYRFVGFYYPSGAKYVGFFKIFEQVEDGEIISMYLVDTNDRIIHRIEAPITPDKRRMLDAFS